MKRPNRRPSNDRPSPTQDPSSPSQPPQGEEKPFGWLFTPPWGSWRGLGDYPLPHREGWGGSIVGGGLGWGGSYEDREHHCYRVLTSNEGIVRMTIKGDSCQATLQPATLGDGAHRRGLSLLRDSKHGLLWATTMDNLYAYRVEADASLQPFPLHDIVGEDKKVLDQLLIAQPDATITDVATKVGFATPKYFSRLFRDKFGVSPKEYTAENPSANLSADNEN